MPGVDGVEEVVNVMIATPEQTRAQQLEAGADSPASHVSELGAEMEAKLEAAADEADNAPAASAPEVVSTTGTDAPDRKQFNEEGFKAAVDKAVAEASAAATAAALAAVAEAKAEPDVFQKMLMTAMETMNLNMKALQSELAASKADNAKLADQVVELEKIEVDKSKAGSTSEGYKKKEEELDEDGEPKLKRLDRKDVDKPDKYGGNADQWLKWSKAFK